MEMGGVSGVVVTFGLVWESVSFLFSCIEAVKGLISLADIFAARFCSLVLQS